MTEMTMTHICKLIRKEGSVVITLQGEDIKVDFTNLVMVGGGYYFVRTADGRRIEVAKGQKVPVK